MLKSGTCKAVVVVVVVVPLQAVRRVSTALSVPRCAAVRTGRTATTSADSVPAGRASSDRAASSVSVNMLLLLLFSEDSGTYKMLDV